MRNKIGTAIVGAAMSANAAWAGSVLEDTVSACTAINCLAMSIRGVHQVNEPFVAQVFAKEGECLRLDVDSQTQDLALLVSSPSVNLAGINDDRDFEGDDFRPLIVIDPVPATGWYTVAVSYFDFGPVVGKFILMYGRYPGGNANCAVAATSSSASLERRGGTSPKAFTK